MILSYNITQKDQDSSEDSVKEEEFDEIETIMKKRKLRKLFFNPRTTEN